MRVIVKERRGDAGEVLTAGRLTKLLARARLDSHHWSVLKCLIKCNIWEWRPLKLDWDLT